MKNLFKWHLIKYKDGFLLRKFNERFLRLFYFGPLAPIVFIVVLWANEFKHTAFWLYYDGEKIKHDRNTLTQTNDLDKLISMFDYEEHKKYYPGKIYDTWATSERHLDFKEVGLNKNKFFAREYTLYKLMK